MKVVYLSAIVLFLSALSGLKAQQGGGLTSNMEVGPSIGLLHFFGDVKDVSSFTFSSDDESKIGYGLNLYKGFSAKKTIGVELGYVGGNLQGTNSDKLGSGVRFNTSLNSLSLGLRWNYLSLFAPNGAEDRKFGWLGFGGVGYTFFNTESVVGPDSLDIPFNENYPRSAAFVSETGAVTYHLGTRVTYKVHENWSVGLGTQLRIADTDALDAWESPSESYTATDMFTYTGFNIAYHFKGRKKREIPVDDQQLADGQKGGDKKKDEPKDDPKKDDPVDPGIPDVVEGTTSVAGLFEYQNLPEEGVTMELVDEDGNVIQTVTSGPTGEFEFKNLDPDKNYLVRLAEKDIDKFSKGNFYVLNDNGDPVKDADKVRSGTFSLKPIPEEDLADLPVIEKPEPKDDDKGDDDKGDDDKGDDDKGDDDKGDDDVVVVDPPDDKGDDDKGDDDVVAVTPENIDDDRVKVKTSGALDFTDETIFFRHNSFWVSQNQNNSKGSVIAKKLNDNPSSRIAIFGFASKVGPPDYNMLLSQRRADKLKSILVEKYKISSDRIVAIGKGEVTDTKMDEELARKAEVREIE